MSSRLQERVTRSISRGGTAFLFRQQFHRPSRHFCRALKTRNVKQQGIERCFRRRSHRPAAGFRDGGRNGPWPGARIGGKDGRDAARMTAVVTCGNSEGAVCVGDRIIDRRRSRGRDGVDAGRRGGRGGRGEGQPAQHGSILAVLEPRIAGREDRADLAPAPLSALLWAREDHAEPAALRRARDAGVSAADAVRGGGVTRAPCTSRRIAIAALLAMEDV
jgi:hypothetical protein